MSDIEIARKATKKNISEMASKLNIDENDLHPFGPVSYTHLTLPTILRV